MSVHENIIKGLRSKFLKGTRVRLEQMDDIAAPPIGTCGTVECVDGIGTIHVNWDNGSTLGVVYPEDRVSKL